MVRWLLIEAVHHVVRLDPEFRQDYHRREFKIRTLCKNCKRYGTLARDVSRSHDRI